MSNRGLGFAGRNGPLNCRCADRRGCRPPARESLLDRVDDLRWDIRCIAEAPDGTCSTRRRSTTSSRAAWVALPCMIALEFTDDLISHWRAYFDVATWTVTTVARRWSTGSVASGSWSQGRPRSGDDRGPGPGGRAGLLRVPREHLPLACGPGRVRPLWRPRRRRRRRSTRPAPAATTSARTPTSTPRPRPAAGASPIDHRGRQFTAADFERFDVVVAMDAANQRDLLRLAPDDAARAKVTMLAGPTAPDVEVPDPWGLAADRLRRDVRPPRTRPAPTSSDAHPVTRPARRAGRRTRRHGATPVSGGDIAQAYRLETPGGPLFPKTHPRPMPGLFEREAAGLRALRADGRHRRARGRPRARRPGSCSSGSTSAAARRRASPTSGAASPPCTARPGPRFGGLDDAPAGYLGSQPVDLTPDRRLADVLPRAAGASR